MVCACYNVSFTRFTTILHFFCPSIPLPHKPRNNYYHILSCWADSLICVCFEIYFTFNTPNLTSGKSYAGWVWLCVCALVFRRLFSLPLLLLLFCLSLSLTRAHARTICTRPGNKRLSIKQNVEHDYMQPTHMVKLIPSLLYSITRRVVIVSVHVWTIPFESEKWSWFFFISFLAVSLLFLLSLDRFLFHCCCCIIKCSIRKMLWGGQ